jgi:hypothetical protein
MFSKAFAESGGRTMIPLSQFAPNPTIGSPLQLETNLDLLPQELRGRIMIPSADERLRQEVEARGFFTIEAMTQVYLMERQFPDGVLDTSPEAFLPVRDYSISGSRRSNALIFG